MTWNYASAQKNKIKWLPESQNYFFMELFFHKSMQQEKAIYKKSTGKKQK